MLNEKGIAVVDHQPAEVEAEAEAEAETEPA